MDKVDCRIICRSYDKDAKWLRESLPTWKRDCDGYSGITVVGIMAQCDAITWICNDQKVGFVADNESAKIPNGYINQQYTKLRADLFTDSEFVLFVDSDTFCYGKHTPEIWWRDGKPILCYSTWEQVGQASCWKKPTEELLKLDAPYEFMRKLPQVYPCSVIKSCREYVERVNGKPLLEIMRGLSSVSEFNVLGCYAWHHAHDAFSWVHPEVDGVPPNPFKQFWSYGNMEEQLRDHMKYNMNHGAREGQVV